MVACITYINTGQQLNIRDNVVATCIFANSLILAHRILNADTIVVDNSTI